MTDIIKKRTAERLEKINIIAAKLKQAGEKKQRVDYQKLLLEMQCQMGVAKKTAREYIETALYMSGYSKELWL
jgi:hypothetical protein